ncbi:hypothetical protein R80B4_03141 [Fibrobacteres bacterium R8-0-B4]
MSIFGQRGRSLFLAALAALAFCVSNVSAQDTFTDTRDRMKYKTVKIGEYMWLAENLDYNVKGSVCYDGKPENCEEYGRLYNFNMAKTACPQGWKLPSKTAWDALINAAGGSEAAGNALKSKSGWKDGENGADKYGFGALPGGYRMSGGGSYSDNGKSGRWWTATTQPSGTPFESPYSIHIVDWLGRVEGAVRSASEGLSVRCVIALTEAAKAAEEAEGAAEAKREKAREERKTDMWAEADKAKAERAKAEKEAKAAEEAKDKFTDARDGKMYGTVKIGKQVWTARNMDFKTGNSWCYGEGGKTFYGYNEKEYSTPSSSEAQENCGKYGRLYDWAAAKKACPAGYHLPSRAEWTALAKAVGGKGANAEYGPPAKALKAKDVWSANNNAAQDSLGFSAVPAGWRDDKGSFRGEDDEGYWWTATENSASAAYHRTIYCCDNGVFEDAAKKGSAFSVRCVKD